MIYLNKINSSFRLKTDLLLFTDRCDIDLSDYKTLMSSSFNNHYQYFWDCFEKTSNVFWDSKFWNSRINIIYDLDIKKISKSMDKFFEKRMMNAVKFKDSPDPTYNIECLQFLEYCKVKRDRGLPLDKVKDLFIEMPYFIRHQKLTKVIDKLIPDLFSSFDEYANLLSDDNIGFHKNINYLLSVDSKIFKGKDNFIANLFVDIFKEDKKNSSKIIKKEYRIMMDMLKSPVSRQLIKDKYDPSFKVTRFFKSYCLGDWENNCFENIKNILDLDPSLFESVLDSYLKLRFNVLSGHRRANVDKVTKAIKHVPQITPKKVLNWLSVNNKSSDIKYLISVYPELSKIALFI